MTGPFRVSDLEISQALVAPLVGTTEPLTGLFQICLKEVQRHTASPAINRTPASVLECFAFILNT